MKKKSLLLFLCMFVVMSTSVFAVSFSDLTSEHWAYEYITVLSDDGVINGYPDGTFNPEGTISRGEFLKLVIAASIPKYVDINGAPDGIDHWAGKYLSAAEIYRVVSPGALNNENIDEPITRMEMALMIAKADVNMRFKSLNSEKDITFNDYDDMNEMEIRYLTHAVSSGLIKGYTDNTFKPRENMTRAEAATMIYRYTHGEVKTNEG